MKWPSDFEEIIKYSEKRIRKFNFDNQTANFLIQNGLPEDAAPFLNFSDDSDDKYSGILKLTDRFDFLEQEFERYVVIGSNGNGDEIAIDTEDNCKIKLLDHEDYFSEQFINASIDKFAFSLIAYRTFISKTLEKYGEGGFLDCKYSLEDVQKLQHILEENDNDAFIGDSMWISEITMLKEEKE